MFPLLSWFSGSFIPHCGSDRQWDIISIKQSNQLDEQLSYSLNYFKSQTHFQWNKKTVS